MNSQSFFDKFRGDPEYERELAAQELLIEAGDRLNELVELRGIQHQELAARLSVSPSRISQALSGDENLTLRTIGRLCHALSASVRINVIPNETMSSGLIWDDVVGVWQKVFSSTVRYNTSSFGIRPDQLAENSLSTIEDQESREDEMGVAA